MDSKFDGFNEAYAFFMRFLVAILRLEPEVAHDVFYTAAVRLAQRPAQRPGGFESLFDGTYKIAFIKTVLRRIFIDVCNKRTKELCITRSVVDDDALREDPNNCESTSVSVALMKAVNKLPDCERTIIQLGFYNGHTLVEIADILDIKYDTVFDLKQRALGRLRPMLGAEENWL